MQLSLCRTGSVCWVLVPHLAFSQSFLRIIPNGSFCFLHPCKKPNGSVCLFPSKRSDHPQLACHSLVIPRNCFLWLLPVKLGWPFGSKLGHFLKHSYWLHLDSQHKPDNLGQTRTYENTTGNWKQSSELLCLRYYKISHRTFISLGGLTKQAHRCCVSWRRYSIVVEHKGDGFPPPPAPRLWMRSYCISALEPELLGSDPSTFFSKTCVVVVQSLSHVWLFETPWTMHARLPCPSLSPRVCSDSSSLSGWCHPTTSSSASRLLLP